jgi:excisionase family DNA binding protein
VGFALDPQENDLATALVEALAGSPAALAQLRELLAAPAAYTVSSLAATLGFSPKAVRNAIARGELTAVKRGGRWIISDEEVARWSWISNKSRGSPWSLFDDRSSFPRGSPLLADALARFERGLSSRPGGQS